MIMVTELYRVVPSQSKKKKKKRHLRYIWLYQIYLPRLVSLKASNMVHAGILTITLYALFLKIYLLVFFGGWGISMVPVEYL